MGFTLIALWHFMRRHLVLFVIIVSMVGVIFFGHVSTLVSLLASSTSSLQSHDAIIYFAPRDSHSLTGETSTIDLLINTRIPVNAVGATIRFPVDTVSIVGISKEDSFLDLWTEDTVIEEEKGALRFSGGTLAKNGLIGSGTLLTLTVKSKRAGSARFELEEVQILAHDGKGSKIKSGARTFTYVTDESPDSNDAIVQGGTPTPAPTADFNGDGILSLADLSILVIQFLAPYNPRFDLDRNGAVNLADLSILFTKMKEQSQ